jgi:thiamine-monophosphate kinase
MNELQWVDLLKKRAGRGKGVITGIGDDCAVVALDKGKYLLKSDLFIEGIHFKRKNISFKVMGMRAVARVLSDFAACGGHPKYIGISAGIPAKVSMTQMQQVLNGVLTLGKKYSFSLVGGDTSCSEKVFFDIWGVGEVKKPILRSSAKTGDYIFVSGKLGTRKFNEPFLPRLKESGYLVNNFKINSMIDITDGFIIDLYRILKESNKGAVVFKDLLPLTTGEKDLYRGEDYELIFTIDKHEKNIETLKKKFYYLGRIKSKSSGFLIKKGNSFEKVKVKGYLHF